MWPVLFFTLSLAFSSSIECRSETSIIKSTAHNLQTRASKGDKFTFDIPGTDLVATVTLTDKIALNIVTDGLLPLLDKKASAMGPNDNPPEITIWPNDGPPNYFPGVFEIVHHCQNPPLNGALLRALSQGIGAYFRRQSEGLDFSLQGFITSKATPSSNLFAFRMFFVSPAVLGSEKKADVTLGIRDLEVIYNVKRKILDLVKPDDLLLFIGNTGSYFYHTIKAADNLNAHLIPYSGDPLNPNYGALTPTQERSFADSILRPAFTAKPSYKRLILISHLRTGQSIDSLITILEDANLIPQNSNPYVINLAYRDLYKNEICRARKVTTLAVIPVGDQDDDFERLDLGWVGRLVPYYSKELWGFEWKRVPNPDLRWVENSVKLIREVGRIKGGS
ncbi:MAG: hypothetical protein Q9164_003567 [Protoblastenia rupestris]